MDITTNQQPPLDKRAKTLNPKRILFRKRHLIKNPNINETIQPPSPPSTPPPDTKSVEEKSSFVQQTSLMSVTGELPRQLIFTGMHFEKQSELAMTEISDTKVVKKIKFMKLFKILGIKLAEENQGEVSISLVATSSPLRSSNPPLERGDVLISIDGRPVTSKRQAEKLLSSLEKGEHEIEILSHVSVLKEEHQENTEVNKHGLQTQQIGNPNKQLNNFQLELIARNKQELFGLELEEVNNNIFVKSIQPKSPAFDSKLIQIGDKILTIDRKLFIEIKIKDANKIYENLPLNQPVLFILERATKLTNETTRQNLPRNLSFRDRIIEVELTRGGDNKLGFVLLGGVDTNEKRVYIRRIGPDSIVATDGRLKVCCVYILVIIIIVVVVVVVFIVVV